MWQKRKDKKEQGITESGFNLPEQCGFCYIAMFLEGNGGICNAGEERQKITE